MLHKYHQLAFLQISQHLSVDPVIEVAKATIG